MLTEAPEEVRISPREYVQSREGSRVLRGGRRCPGGCEPEDMQVFVKGLGEGFRQDTVQKDNGRLPDPPCTHPTHAPPTFSVVVTT